MDISKLSRSTLIAIARQAQRIAKAANKLPPGRLTEDNFMEAWTVIGEQNEEIRKLIKLLERIERAQK